jgi:hypothetical protein
VPPNYTNQALNGYFTGTLQAPGEPPGWGKGRRRGHGQWLVPFWAKLSRRPRIRRLQLRRPSEPLRPCSRPPVRRSPGFGPAPATPFALYAPSASTPFALYRAPRAARRSGAGRQGRALQRARAPRPSVHTLGAPKGAPEGVSLRSAAASVSTPLRASPGDRPPRAGSPARGKDGSQPAAASPQPAKASPQLPAPSRRLPTASSSPQLQPPRFSPRRRRQTDRIRRDPQLRASTAASNGRVELRGTLSAQMTRHNR